MGHGAYLCVAGLFALAHIAFCVYRRDARGEPPVIRMLFIGFIQFLLTVRTHDAALISHSNIDMRVFALQLVLFLIYVGSMYYRIIWRTCKQVMSSTTKGLSKLV